MELCLSIAELCGSADPLKRELPGTGRSEGGGLVAALAGLAAPASLRTLARACWQQRLLEHPEPIGWACPSSQVQAKAVVCFCSSEKARAQGSGPLYVLYSPAELARSGSGVLREQNTIS